MTTTTHHFGPLLREIRQAKGMKQKTLAEAIGVSPNYLGDVEKSYRPPLTPDRMEAAFDALDLDRDTRNRLASLAAEERLAGVDLKHIATLIVDRVGPAKARGLIERAIAGRGRK